MAYQIFLPGSLASGTPSFALQLGTFSPEIAKLHAAHTVETSVFLTAYNPGGVPSDPVKNLHRQADLFGFLSDLGLTWFDGAGVAERGSWPEEPRALVMGLSLEEAYQAARRYGQNSFVYSGSDCIPRLICTIVHPSAPEIESDDAPDTACAVTPEDPDLHSLAQQYGVSAATPGALANFARALGDGAPRAGNPMRAVFTSRWQRIGEELAQVYRDHPDALPLHIGHHAPGGFVTTISLTLADARSRFERRHAPRHSS